MLRSTGMMLQVTTGLDRAMLWG